MHVRRPLPSGGPGQGRAVASAVEGIARNPGAAGKTVTPMIIGLAMIESLVIYGLVVALILVFKLQDPPQAFLKPRPVERSGGVSCLCVRGQ